MANLTGMPISSLPETTLQEGDQVIGYRADTGKAYRTDLANEVSSLRNEVAELKDSLTDIDIFNYGTQIPVNDLNDLLTVGKYYGVGSDFDNSPISSGGALFVIALRGTGLVQIWIGSTSTLPIFMRYYTDGNWYNWRTISST